MIHFTADWHLDHNKILTYEKDRPWKDVSSMSKGLIKNYNEIVQEDDEVYFIGDIVWWGPDYWRRYREMVFHKLKGTKHLVLGNHDAWNPFLYIKAGFTSVHTSLPLEEFILIHDPSASIMDKSKVWLCGHVHSLFKAVGNVINVGVDVWDYKPVSIDEIRKFLLERENARTQGFTSCQADH